MKEIIAVKRNSGFAGARICVRQNFLFAVYLEELQKLILKKSKDLDSFCFHAIFLMNTSEVKISHPIEILRKQFSFPRARSVNPQKFSNSIFYKRISQSVACIYKEQKMLGHMHAGKDTFFCSLKGRKVQRYTNQSMTGVEACFLIKNF